MRLSGYRLLLASGYLLGLGSVAYFGFMGRGYYLTPLLERPRHELYWSFKPGGELGLRFGIAGAALMVLMLGYVLRKRIKLLRRWGSMKLWLDVHILFGICGPCFIVLHSSFKVHGLVSLSFWSMVAVALSGVVGRFLYRQIPRTGSGVELSLEEVQQVDRELARRLVEEFGLPEEEVRSFNSEVESLQDPRRPLLRLLVSMPLDHVRLRMLLRRFHRRNRHLAPRLRSRFLEVSRRKAQLSSRLLLWQRLRELFHYWHVAHKPFAVIMYLFMVVHVAVALVTGYGWIGG